jgi:hypothetical protein
MKHPPLRGFFPPVSAWAAVVLLVACALPASSRAQGSGAATADITATVRAVDDEAQEIEILSGVGFALRIHSIKVGPGCQVTIGGQQAALSELKPGQVVRVRYRETDEGKVALAIDTPPPPPRGER